MVVVAAVEVHFHVFLAGLGLRVDRPVVVGVVVVVVGGTWHVHDLEEPSGREMVTVSPTVRQRPE